METALKREAFEHEHMWMLAPVTKEGSSLKVEGIGLYLWDIPLKKYDYLGRINLITRKNARLQFLTSKISETEKGGIVQAHVYVKLNQYCYKTSTAPGTHQYIHVTLPRSFCA